MALQQLLGKAEKLVVGLMSGTSLDGIDAAIVRISGTGVDTKAELVHFSSVAYEDRFREKIKELCNPDAGNTPAICGMNFLLAERFADAAKQAVAEAGLSMGDIDLISSHGQTIWHIPEADAVDEFLVRSTLQIGDLSVLAKRTGVVTVGDFRTADMAVGGQGAPLVPYLDYILFRDEANGRILQNIGGIGNCTAIPAGGSPDSVIAFDTGPGNMLIDQTVWHYSRGEKSYDRGGQWAASGSVNEPMLDELMAHPYISMTPPKTTGREMFGKAFAMEWISRAEERGLAPADVIATFTAFTARTIAQAYKDFILPAHAMQDVVVSGGGAHNAELLRMLAAELPGMIVRVSDDLGLSSDAKEAVAFAVLGAAFLHGETNNLPAATGAPVATVMGKLALP